MSQNLRVVVDYFLKTSVWFLPLQSLNTLKAFRWFLKNNQILQEGFIFLWMQNPHIASKSLHIITYLCYSISFIYDLFAQIRLPYCFFFFFFFFFFLIYRTKILYIKLPLSIFFFLWENYHCLDEYI